MLPSDARDAYSKVPSGELLLREYGLRRQQCLSPENVVFRNGSIRSADVYTRMRSQEPQIAEVARLVASPVLESHDLFGGDFVQAVHGDWVIFRYIFEFWIGA
jgi:hypothetical protein